MYKYRYIFNIKIYKLQNNNILLSFIDITRLHKLENLRSDFIGNVSHELKTPLSTLMNIIELFIHQKKKIYITLILK